MTNSELITGKQLTICSCHWEKTEPKESPCSCEIINTPPQKKDHPWNRLTYLQINCMRKTKQSKPPNTIIDKKYLFMIPFRGIILKMFTLYIYRSLNDSSSSKKNKLFPPHRQLSLHETEAQLWNKNLKMQSLAMVVISGSQSSDYHIKYLCSSHE